MHLILDRNSRRFLDFLWIASVFMVNTTYLLRNYCRIMIDDAMSLHSIVMLQKM